MSSITFRYENDEQVVDGTHPVPQTDITMRLDDATDLTLPQLEAVFDIFVRAVGYIPKGK